MSEILGTEPIPFLGMTIILFGLAAAATGQALARNWKPAWQIAPLTLLLAVADRCLHYALFAAPLDSFNGLLAAAAVLGLIMAVAFFHVRARKVVRQYPWLYEPNGPLGWRARQSGRAG